MPNENTLIPAHVFHYWVVSLNDEAINTFLKNQSVEFRIVAPNLFDVIEYVRSIVEGDITTGHVPALECPDIIQFMGSYYDQEPGNNLIAKGTHIEYSGSCLSAITRRILTEHFRRKYRLNYTFYAEFTEFTHGSFMGAWNKVASKSLRALKESVPYPNIDSFTENLADSLSIEEFETVSDIDVTIAAVLQSRKNP